MNAPKLSPELEAIRGSLQAMRRDEQEIRELLANRLSQLQAEVREIRRMLASREYLGGEHA